MTGYQMTEHASTHKIENSYYPFINNTALQSRNPANPNYCKLQMSKIKSSANANLFSNYPLTSF